MDTKKVTRVEVINHIGINERGRVYTLGPMEGINVEVSLQDDGRTLKVFIDHATPRDGN